MKAQDTHKARGLLSTSESIDSLHIVYIVERFPSLTEHFILNEILALEKYPIRITILSISKPRTKLPMKQAPKLSATVYYSSGTWLSLIENTGKCCKCLLNIFKPHHHHLSLRSALKQMKHLAISLTFEKKIGHLKISHIHAHFGFIAADIGSILSERLSVIFSFTAHASDIYQDSVRLIQNVKKAHFVITCTRYNLNYINDLTQNLFSGKLHLIYHGINPDEPQPNLPQKPNRSPEIRILTVARLVEKKGIIYLLKAIKTLTVKTKYRITCDIIGDGPLKKNLKKFVKETELSDHIKFTGYRTRSEVLEEMSCSDIFVLPCIVAANGDRDGIPNVLLEAIMMGVPVISTSVSGIPELIEDEYSGLLVLPKNAESLANAIIRIIEDNALCCSISARARENLISCFHSDLSAEEIFNLFLKYAKN